MVASIYAHLKRIGSQNITCFRSVHRHCYIQVCQSAAHPRARALPYQKLNIYRRVTVIMTLSVLAQVTSWLGIPPALPAPAPPHGGIRGVRFACLEFVPSSRGKRGISPRSSSGPSASSRLTTLIMSYTNGTRTVVVFEAGKSCFVTPRSTEESTVTATLLPR